MTLTGPGSKFVPSRCRFVRPALGLALAALWSVAVVNGTAWGQLRLNFLGANVDVSNLPGNESDAVVAINPASSQQMFIVANTNVDAGLFGAYSINGGLSWIPTPLTGIPIGAYPAVAWDGYGNLFLAYADGAFSGTDLAVSTNGGQTFNLLTNLAPTDTTLEQRIAVGSGTSLGSLWVVHKDYNAPGNPLFAQGVAVSGLGNFGVFGPPLLVSGSTNCGYGDIAVGPQGQVMVAFQNNLQSSNAASIFVSMDSYGLGTNTFGTNMFGTNMFNPGGFGTNGFGPRIFAATGLGGDTHIPAQPDGQGINAAAGLAWDDNPASSFYGRAYLIHTAFGPLGSPNTDILVTSSTNAGVAWGQNLTVNDNQTGSSQFLPRMAIDSTDGAIVASWYDCRKDLGIVITPIPTNIMVFDTNTMMTNTIMTTNFSTNDAGDLDGITNDDAEFYAAVSVDGAMTFSANVAVTTNASESFLAVSTTDFGDDTGVAFYGGTFVSVWAGNSTNRPTLDIIAQPLALSGLANLSLTMILTNTPLPVTIGDVITYFLTLSNGGPSTVIEPTVTDTFSPLVSFIFARPSAGNETVNGNTLSWSPGVLGVGHTATILLRTVAGGVGNATNFALAVSEAVDLLTNNNAASLITPIVVADLALTMTGAPGAIAVGDLVTYTLTVSNAGPVPAGGVVISNNLPANLAFTGAVMSQGTYTNDQPIILFGVGSLDVGQTATVILTATAQTLGNSTDVAVVFDNQIDTNPLNNTAQVSTAVLSPDVAMGMSGSPAAIVAGGTVTYTINVTNLGPVLANGVGISNTFTANLIFTGVTLSQGTFSQIPNGVVCNLGSLTNGQTALVTLTVIGQSFGRATNTAVLFESQPDPVPGNNTARVSTTISSAPPPISNLSVHAAGTGAFIIWDSGSNATAQVAYGTTASYGAISSLNPILSTHHIVLLTGLQPDTNYFFQAQSVSGGVLYTSNSTFSLTTTLILATPDATYAGPWTASGQGTGIYSNYYQASTGVVGAPTASAVFDPHIPASGTYDVSIWYPVKSGFAGNAPVTITGATNTLTLNLDETVNGGNWLLLAGSMYFAAGTTGSLAIFNNTGDTNTSVIANAVRWVYNLSQDTPANGSVPAWWADIYFGVPAVNGAADADGDGYSNYAEFILGTDPTSASSQLNLSVAGNPSGSLTVTFTPWQGGRLYQLQSATSLTSPAWLTLTNTATVAPNGSGTFTVNPSGAPAFYRLSAALAP